jgi:5-formyltetrahydrofolate cyclo-ligase
MQIPQTKQEIRRQIRELWQSQNPAQRILSSQAVCERLLVQAVWKQAQGVLFYAPMAEEVDVWPLIGLALDLGKAVYLPKFDADHQRYRLARVCNLESDLKLGWRGIREPADHCGPCLSNPLDLCLVPGVAFGLEGERLGRGKGYYDQLLTAMRGFKCGVGFDFQVRNVIPMEPHDIYLDCILTPTRWCVAKPRLV